MNLRTRLIRAVSGDCGPTNKNVLRGIAKAHGQLPRFAKILRALLDAGDIVMYGTRKAAVYGPPGWRRKRRSA
jgi:hypothetical protein